MVATAVMRDAWKQYLCIADHPDRRPVTILGRNAGWCPPEMIEPFAALSQALTSTGYRDAFDVWVPRKCSVGIGGKRCKPDGTDCSLHNYGVAVDIDPPTPSDKVVRNGSANPIYGPKGHWKFGDIKLTEAQVEAVEAIRTTGGRPLFQWLGDSRINDTMHFEVQVPPEATAVDWDTVPGPQPAGTSPAGTAGTAGAPTYVVQEGDTMGKIAKRFGTTTAELAAANPQIPNPDRIFPGQVITLPRSEAPTPSTPPPPGTTYVVQSGDTMGKIARRFKITMAELIAANPSIPNPDSIFPGQVLAVPTPA